ncbi:uncharacterized protein BO80DRAFT_261999 [Aspergillus ibericus CBS 121593]|uniref:Uncharacterized protein n=1 Tax=Aspergillus ibericus CBS 121593 TaxID=1448316 RepID=A0A395GJ60_9EURO|nr:hypothetical protein BO80DRAFT_261999 [Aspergillus ibericus CBS 121593]RAK95520.1 hypothetical protein BO80DRAFT_261999 [Aspergillus ibericus CBS 121593]
MRPVQRRMDRSGWSAYCRNRCGEKGRVAALDLREGKGLVGKRLAAARPLRDSYICCPRMRRGTTGLPDERRCQKLDPRNLICFHFDWIGYVLGLVFLFLIMIIMINFFRVAGGRNMTAYDRARCQ